VLTASMTRYRVKNVTNMKNGINFLI